MGELFEWEVREFLNKCKQSMQKRNQTKGMSNMRLTQTTNRESTSTSVES